MTLPELAVLASLDELAELVEDGENLYVRWSRDPEADLRDTGSVDSLTGVPLPGLSANPLGVEAWWTGRPTRLWVARRLYDYCHLRRERGPGVRPWVLEGREAGRGPDNEPLVCPARAIAWIGNQVIAEAEREVALQRGAWGPLRRAGGPGPSGRRA